MRRSLSEWSPYVNGNGAPVVCCVGQKLAVDVMQKLLTEETTNRPKGAAALLAMGTLAAVGRFNTNRVIRNNFNLQQVEFNMMDQALAMSKPTMVVNTGHRIEGYLAVHLAKRTTAEEDSEIAQNRG